MSYEATGKLVKIFDIESKTATFQAREFVIEIPGNYPQLIKFQLTQDRCSVVDPYKVGDEVKVSFDLRGREWNEKYFTNLNAWKVEGVQAQAPVASAPAANNNGNFPTEEPFNSGGDNFGMGDNTADDLPF